jgi:hypothetical protein
MSLIGILVFLIICGLIWYLVTLLPLPPPFPILIRVVFILIAILWLASQLGAFGGFNGSSRIHF